MTTKQAVQYGLLSAMVMILAVPRECRAQTTQFTYQGKLTDTGVLANGNYDLQFKLFDTTTVGTGTQQGGTLTLTGVAVTGGIFTVQLDFGANVFPGAARFLEISVKPTSGSTFTTLGPRQPLASSPYTIRSLNATSADGLSVACVNCVTSGQIQSVQGMQVIGNIAGSQISGSIPVASVPPGSTNYVQNTTSQQAASNFNISGSGTVGGTLAGNIVNAITQFNIGGIRALTVDGSNSNVYAGYFAGNSNTTGVHNSFFGHSAGFSNQTGGDNAFFGFGAGSFSTGFSDSFFGSLAGSSNTTGSENAFFGRAAGQANTTGNNNAFFGRSAGNANTTGTSNAFFGRSAGQSNTAGGNNAFFGDLAGNSSNANSNSFFGSGTGFSSTSGASDSFFGSLAGSNNTTGGFNSFFGFTAGPNNTTGSFNAFFGWNAGIRHTTGTFNTFIGVNTGYISDNPTGNSNTLLGYGGTVIAGVSNGTAVGALAQVNVSNALVLGSINGVNGATADTAVGIGTTAPSARLQVVTTDDTNPGVIPSWDSRHLVIGGIANSGAIGMSYDQTNSVGYIEALTPNVAWRNLAIQAGGGNVGIGTTMPFDRLHVNGIIRVNLLGAAGGTSLCLNGSNQISNCSSSLRYKTDVRAFIGGLDIISRLRPISFTWKQDGSSDIGLAAEEVEQVEPLLTFRNNVGEIEGVKYAQATVVLINAIKEQQTQIEAQRRELEQQRQQIDMLKKLVCADHPAARFCRQTK